MNTPAITLVIPPLADSPIWNFNSDGTVFDLASPDARSVDFLEVAKGLSGISRFNGRGISVAQHSVMGAQAILNERGTEMEAALFLLHDAHEWALGDITRPMQTLMMQHLSHVHGSQAACAFEAAISAVKSKWDSAVYAAACLPLPEFWSARQKRTVKDMDDRMCRAEAIDLFGAASGSQFPKSERPKTVGAIRPWLPFRAEEEFLAMLHRLAGPETIAKQCAMVSIARGARR